MEIRDKTQKVKKSIILGSIVLVAVAAVGYFSFFYPPGGKHLTGTIAPAARYHAEQIGNGDVKVAETDLTRWTQTAEFDHLSKDPAARKLFANAAFRNALASDGFVQALRNDAFVQALRKDAFAQALRNDALVQALRNDGFAQALRNDAFVQALRNDAFVQALRNDAFVQALRNDAFHQALARE